MAVKLREIELINCFQHTKLKAKLSDFHVIVGKNGAGKSNLLWSILYGLGCKFGLPGTKDTMITSGCDKGSVRLLLEHAGEEVELKANLGTTGRRLKRGDLKIGANTEVLDYVQNALLGTSFDVLTQSSVIMQGKLDEGLFSAPAERMRAFMRIAGLMSIEAKRRMLEDEKAKHSVPMLMLSIEEAESYIVGLRKEHADIQDREHKLAELVRAVDVKALYDTLSLLNEVREAREQLPDKQAELSTLRNRDKSAANDLAAVKTEIEEFTKMLQEFKVDYEAAREAVAAHALRSKRWAERQSLIKELDECVKQLDSMHGLEAPVTANRQELLDLKVELGGKLAALDQSNKGLREALKRGANSECPVCHGELSAEKAKSMLAEQEAQVQELAAMDSELSASIRAVDTAETAYKATLSAYEKKHTALETTVSVKRNALKLYDDATDPGSNDDQREVILAYDELSAKRDVARETYDRLNDATLKTVNAVAKLEGIVDVLAKKAALEYSTDRQRELETNIEAANKNVQSLGELQGRRAEIASQIEKKTAELKELMEQQKRAEKLRKYINIIETAREALHRDNFPSGKIKAFIDRMLLQTNQYLDVMQSGFSVSYDNEDGFLAYFPSEGKFMRADRLSGGEKVVFALAFRFSVNELRSDTGFLILDEPTVYLDDNHVERMIEALALVKAKLAPRVQVIVVTHDDRLMAVADGVLTIGSAA